jgi:hypothetical protein
VQSSFNPMASQEEEDWLLLTVVCVAVASAVALDGRLLNRGAGAHSQTHVVCTDWFDKMMSAEVSDKVFKQQFRMEKTTFDSLVEVIKEAWVFVHGKSSMTQIDNAGGGIRKRVAAFLYIVSHGLSVTTVQTMFGKSSTNVSKSTVSTNLSFELAHFPFNPAALAFDFLLF